MSRAIELAKECGFPEWWISPPEPERQNGEAARMIEAFYRRAQEEMKERCAKVCEARGERNRLAAGLPNGDRDEFYCADDIRALK